MYEAIYQSEDRGDRVDAARLRAKQQALLDRERWAELELERVLRALLSGPPRCELPRAEMYTELALSLARRGLADQVAPVAAETLEVCARSRHRALVHLLLADALADTRPAEARPHYDEVAARGDGLLRAYALYRRALLRLDARESEAALADLIAVVRVSNNHARGVQHSPRASLLRSAALRVVPWAFAASRPARAALPLFERLTEESDTSTRMATATADVYRLLDDPASSAELYAQLLAREPADIHACDWRYGWALDQMARGDDATRWRALVSLRDEAARSDARDLPRRFTRSCHYHAGNLAAALALQWHARGLATRDPVTLARAARAYRLCLSNFAHVLNLAAVAADYDRLERGEPPQRALRHGAAF
ncbi:MAG: hypothetical protein H6713_25675 [Myxococcales bacterium]|nr:hypothetical protein [Myxococcales bacterium]